MIRPPWCEPDWDAMEERCHVTLVIDITGLQEWALAACPWADWGASAWKGAALMAKVLNEKWGRDFDVSFTKWRGDDVAEFCYPTGERDPDGDELAVLDDVKDRTVRAVFSALEDGEWILAAEPCFGIWRISAGKTGAARLLYDTKPTAGQAERRLGEAIARHLCSPHGAGVCEWVIEPMPPAGRAAL